MKLLSKFSTETQVGLLVLLGIGTTVYFSAFITGWKPDESATYRLAASFENASGLSESTAVRIAGIKAGSVETITLEGGKAKVTMNIFEKYPVYANATASIRSLGILGDKYVEIDQGSSSREQLIEGDEIKLIFNEDNLDAIIQSVTGILGDVKGVTEALNQSMGGEEGAGKFNRILANTEALTLSLRQAFEKTNASIDSILVNFDRFTANLNGITEENRGDVRRIVADFRETSGQLKAIATENRSTLNRMLTRFESFGATLDEETPAIAGKVQSALDEFKTFGENLNRDTPQITERLKDILEENREALKNSLANLEKATDRLEKAMVSLGSGAENIDSITEKIDQGEGTIGQLINDAETVESINEALEGVNELVGQATRSRLDMAVRLEYLPGLEEKNAKGYVQLEYKPAPDHSYLLGLNNSPQGKRSTTTTETTTTQGGNTSTQTKTEKETKDDFLLSLQIAQRYYDTRFRVGFFESAVGLGVDQYFGKSENVRLFGEIFDFSREDQGPHFKLGVDYYLWEHLYLTFGGDDVVNENEDFRQYYLGFGLDFNEDDLKLLAGSLPLSSF